MKDSTTRVKGKEPWRSAAQQLLDESGARIVKWRSSSSGCAYTDGSRRIEVPEPRGAASFDTFAHEIGHIVLHDRNGRVPRWREEVETTEFALEQFTRFGLKGRQKMREKRVPGIAYAFGKALRRGADPAAIESAFPGWWKDTQAYEEATRMQCRKRGCTERGRYSVATSDGGRTWQPDDWMGEPDIYEGPDDWPDRVLLYCHLHAEALAEKHTARRRGRGMSRSPARQGIAERTDASGRTHYRGTAYDKRAKRHLKGPWTPNLAEARAWRVDALARLQAGTLSAAQGPTVREAVEQFLAGVESGAIRAKGGRPHKPSTIRAYEKNLRSRVAPAFGPTRLARLTRGDVQRWVDSLDGAPSSVRNAVTALQALYRWATSRELVQVNPARGLELPSDEKKRDRIAAPDEARTLIAAMPATDQAVMGLGFYAGLRLGEALAMRWGDIEPERLHVRRSWDATARTFGEPKHGSVRTVPICDELAALLADHRVLMNHPADGLLFPSPRIPGQPVHPTRLRRRMYAAWEGMERLGFHEARHSYASLSAAAGIRLEVLSKRMGHSSIKVTYDRYHHLYPDSEAEERDALNAYLRTHSRTHDA